MAQHGTPISYAALLLVVPATIAAFAWLRPNIAVLVILLGSLMFLPELVVFDAPLVPPMGKESIPALCMLIGAFATSWSKIRDARPGRGIDLLMLLALFASVGTVLTNKDPLAYGPVTIQGHTGTDILSEMIRMILGPLIPFFLGRTLFRSAADARDLLKALAVAGTIYFPLVALELRISPQLHGFVYGFGQHSWEQTIRAGGWRPQCFMAHGLALALFMCACSLAAFGLAKARVRVLGIPAGVVGFAILLLLTMMNSLGALIYAIVVAPVCWFTKPKTQMRVAAVLAFIVAAYPILRFYDLFPRAELVDYAAQISQDRAQSLDFRFMHEEMLLEKAVERQWFGWGGFARSHIFNQRGVDVSVIDGAWIGLFGVTGIVGYVARFGLLLLPIFIARRSLKNVTPQNQPLLAGVTLISTVYVIDLLPNGMFNELPMFLAGTVTGLSQGMSKERAHNISPQLIAQLLELLRIRTGPARVR